MTRYHEQVAAALGAVTITGPTRFTWLGRPSRRLPASLAAELGESGRRAYLLACLRDELYCSFYCHGRAVPARWGEPEPAFADRRLVGAMSRANGGHGSWEPGWTVERLDDALAVVVSGRLRARLPVGDCRASSGVVRPGAGVSVPLPRELPEASPGFYTVVGDAAEDSPPEAGVRVYWSIDRTGAPLLVGALTTALNGAGLPFRLKVANHPYRLQRSDASVLYLRGDVFRSCRASVTEIAARLSAHLRPHVPALTLEFAPGVGLAEEAGEPESFGVRRCTLLADAIVRAHDHGIAGIEARVDAVAARFAEDGVRLEAPYLEPSLAGRHVL